MSKDLRIVFMGTPEFAVASLKAMLDAGKNIVGVITAPDRPAGRGRKISQSAVKKYALEKDLNILQPTNLKDESFLEELASLGADLQVVVAFRMLPKEVWKMPKRGTFNLHASLLPQYRGAAPINWAVVNQEKKTGVTTFFIDEKIDTGEIILSKEVELKRTETAGTLHDTLMMLGQELVLETIAAIESGEVKTHPQNPKGEIRMAPKLTTDNTRIDWTLSGEAIEAFIRGLTPYPVAWTMLTNNEERLKVKIYAAKFEEEEHKDNLGDILVSKRDLKIAVKNGYIWIQEMQLPGKRNMEVVDLLNGYTFEAGAKLL